MNEQDKSEFAQVVRASFNNYGREAPMQETLRMWWGILTEFDIAAVRMAFSKHITTEPKYPPTIGQVLEILTAGNKAGRLGAEEAWALAVRACDETETVVMNDHVAEAWGIAKPIMDLGDEVGARMAFKEAYTRITTGSTAPAKWWPSIGSDPHKRDSALAEAKRAGLLPAPQVAALLPPPEPTPSKCNPDGLKRLKAEMERMKVKRIADANAVAAERQRLRDEDEARKREIAARVSAYQGAAQ